MVIKTTLTQLERKALELIAYSAECSQTEALQRIEIGGIWIYKCSCGKKVTAHAVETSITWRDG